MSDLGNKKIMAKNIIFYMEKANKTRNDVCRDLGISYTTFTDWVKGNTYPRIDKIEAMANYFGITKSDLVEEKPATTNDDRFLNDLQNMLQDPLAKEAYSYLNKIASNPQLLKLAADHLRLLEEMQGKKDID